MRGRKHDPAFADSLDFVERKERILIMKSNVMEKTFEQEHLTAIELTDKELEEVQGAIAVAAQNLALSGGFFQPIDSSKPSCNCYWWFW